jgi:hypothetical protein
MKMMREMNDELLLEIDLCSRLSHMTLMVKWGNENYNIIDVGFGRVTVLKPFMSYTAGSPLIREVKPYLRPMSSMTEDEEKEFLSLGEGLTYNMNTKCLEYKTERQIWLDVNCFDYRGLIPKGLALEAPEGMYTPSTKPRKDDRTATQFKDRNGNTIYEGDIFVYTKYSDFDADHIPEDLIENWSKYEDSVSLHPVFWDHDKTDWCSDVCADCDSISRYNFTQVVVVTNNIDHPELYNH